jgi:hypothetical protein
LLAFLAGQANQQDGQLKPALEFAQIREHPGDLAPRAPLLQKRGLQLVAREAGNFALPAHPGLIASACPSTTPCDSSPA